MNGTEYAALAEQFGTPMYLFDLDVLRARMEAVRGVLGDAVRLCYSMKANPFLVRSMLPLVETLEVCSPGELEICAACGVAPERVLLSGVCKTPQDIEEALAFSVTTYTAESMLQVQELERQAAARGLRLSVLPRVAAGSQFGMDEEDFIRLLRARARYPHLDFCGLHYFTGTQHKKPELQRRELERVFQLLTRAKEEGGVSLRRVEYGPGLAVPYFAAESFAQPMALLEALAPALQRLAQQVELTVEMGRFFTASCGSYLTRIVDVKRSGEASYVFVDGGIHHVNYYGQTMAMQVPVMRHFDADGTEKEAEANAKSDTAQRYTLCGSLCTLADVLVRRAAFTNPAVGDILLLCHLGAYAVTESPYLFLSRRLPAIVLCSAAQGARLVRGAQPTSNLNTER